jgi:hypothetical protein
MTFFILMILFQPQAKDISQIREKYHLAIYNEKIANALDAELQALEGGESIFKGYQGAVKMLLASFAFMPNTKYAFFTNGKVLLEKAIIESPSDLELRYLRLSIQQNTPSFLGYKSDIETDKQLLLRGVSDVKDADLKIRIKSYLISSCNLTEAERQLLK